MESILKQLDERECSQLLKFPAYISLLAANSVGGLDVREMKAVMKLTHIRTFTCEPILADFYARVESTFEATITELNQQLPGTKQEREAAIRKELARLDIILKRVGKNDAAIMRHSLKAYKDHVSKAHRNVLEYFIFPLPIEGLTD
jgi:hypothetical protein